MGNLKEFIREHRLMSTGLLVLSASWFSLILAITRANDYLAYPVKVIQWGVLVIPLIFAFLMLAASRRTDTLTGFWQDRKTARLAAVSLLISAILTWHYPLAYPAIALPHTVKLISTGARDPLANGAVLEIRSASGLDGQAIPFEAFELSGDWEIYKGRLVTNGKIPGASAIYRGGLAGGLVLTLRHNDNAGVLQVGFDQQAVEYNLYYESGITFPIAIQQMWGKGSPWQQQLLVVISYLLNTLGLAVLGLLLQAGAQRAGRFQPILLLVFYGMITLGYLLSKQLYPTFNAGRAFRDTYSYVQAAELPLSAREFWIGKRTFTLPLVYKALEMDLENYTSKESLERAGSLQFWLSAASWALLAAVLAASLRNAWVGLAAFTLVLFYSLNLEISFWDSLLLSESISFSLFALLLAAWLGLGLLPKRVLSGLWGWIYLAGVMLVSVLYSFTRDTNLYFVLAGAAVMGILLVSRRADSALRRYYLVYLIFAAGLFIFQNSSLQFGDRWQIHIYDHLALRILPDEQARTYFVSRGMPLNNDLMAITGMKGYEYHDYLDYDPKMEAVRQWINASGRDTFLSYLISHPAVTFWEPVVQTNNLLNGSNLEYRYPRHPLQPIPERILRINEKFYPHQVLILIAIFIVILAGLWAAWPSNGSIQPVWWVLGLLLLSIYPLMVIIWNGNPLEVERHAAQIGIQYRLAGWIGLVLLLNKLSYQNGDQPASQETN